MSLLAAAVPIAVLVLAWDETNPAVRALMDATETAPPVLDSVVVLVPAAAGAPTQEEYLPLAAAPTLPEAAEPQVASAAEPAEPALSAVPPAPQALPPTTPTSTPPALGTPATPPPGAAPLAVAARVPLAWSVVRVLRLSSFDLPGLVDLSKQALPRPIWQHSAMPPAAPYLGSQPDTPTSGGDLEATSPAVAATRPTLPEDARDLPAPTLPATGQPAESAAVPPAPDYLLTASPQPALDAEADLASILPNELATEADPTEPPLAAAPGNAQAGWSEALASLRTPLPIDEPAAAEFEDEAAYYAAAAGEVSAVPGTELAASELVGQPFSAPDLNFQVIQYARFAVPVALAQAPFAAIYAPAWPTWLAAQELRHRTRQPLVLHVATLAAASEESVVTATGWQAELQRQALQRADLILTETPELAHRLRHDLGLPPELVRAVPAADAAAVAQALRTARVRPSSNVA